MFEGGVVSEFGDCAETFTTANGSTALAARTQAIWASFNFPTPTLYLLDGSCALGDNYDGLAAIGKPLQFLTLK